ncbi:hypothetical protein R3P38DRAFT_3214926 [Favolaschia claudopus]|uniref:Uncharacterized protein n=1 Tax=Favolaschia claudopus TaxID=2862362 RepID=A0AAW0AA47_9AGAR
MTHTPSPPPPKKRVAAPVNRNNSSQSPQPLQPADAIAAAWANESRAKQALWFAQDRRKRMEYEAGRKTSDSRRGKL